MDKHLKKNILYYLIYILLYYLMYTICVSFVAFIYFVLDHGLSDIDNWLSSNSWELVIVSKLLSLGIILKILDLNSPKNLRLKYFMKNNLKLPSYQILVCSIFIMITLYSLINNNETDLISRNTISNFTMQSALGSFLFYFIDFFIITFLLYLNKLNKKKSKILFLSICFSLFLLMAQFTLVYLSKYIFFVILNLFFMTLIIYKSKNILMNMVIYCSFVISPLASIYGLDLIWDNKHALYNFNEKLPYLSIGGVWFISYLYYFRRV